MDNEEARIQAQRNSETMQRFKTHVVNDMVSDEHTDEGLNWINFTFSLGILTSLVNIYEKQPEPWSRITGSGITDPTLVNNIFFLTSMMYIDDVAARKPSFYSSLFNSKRPYGWFETFWTKINDAFQSSIYGRRT